MRGFIDFIREQGVMGLAIGFIVGGAISRLVASFVQDIVQPLIGFFLKGTDTLGGLTAGPVNYGKFILAATDFIILAAVVYFLFKGLGLDKLDKKKDKK